MPSSETLPIRFIERLAQLVPKEHLNAVLLTFSKARPTSFRVNRLKTTTTALLAELTPLGITPQPVSWYEAAFSIPTAQRELLTSSDAFLQGRLYIQDLASMLVPLVLNPQPQETILDLAAAPGSKTSQIACLMQNQGRLAAVEKSKPRFFKLKNNLQTQGVTCAQLYLKDGALVWRHCESMFDRVLLDAPCSSEARFTLQDPQTFQFWDEKKIAEMARAQWRLLYSAFRCLKPGGILVYSTCSFAPEENEAQLAKLIKKFPAQVSIEHMVMPITNTQPGLSQWQNKTFPLECQRAIRILPNESMGGFFICCIKRIF